MKMLYKLSIVFVLLVNLFSCEGKKKKELPFDSKQDYENTMIRSHQEFLRVEKEKIIQFIDSSEFEFESTGTGLYYSIYGQAGGDSIKTGDIVVLEYVLKSIEGDTLYKMEGGNYGEFAADYDMVERGLHEGIKLMTVGKRAIFILPAHLAHGITGDQAAIPSQTTVVYYVHLLGKK